MIGSAYLYDGFYTIVLTEHCDDHIETSRNIFKDCWSLYISNVNVIIPMQHNDTVLMVTYFPYAPGHCEHIDPVVYDVFENDAFVNNAPVFPNKFRNFHQCPLRISTYQVPPFMILTPQSNHTDGIDGIILETFSKELNFTPIIILSNTNMLRTMKDNSSVTRTVQPPKLRRSLEMVKSKHFVTTPTSIQSLFSSVMVLRIYQWVQSLCHANARSYMPCQPHISMDRWYMPSRRASATLRWRNCSFRLKKSFGYAWF